VEVAGLLEAVGNANLNPERIPMLGKQTVAATRTRPSTITHIRTAPVAAHA
jgi:hypothetical protein